MLSTLESDPLERRQKPSICCWWSVVDDVLTTSVRPRRYQVQNQKQSNHHSKSYEHGARNSRSESWKAGIPTEATTIVLINHRASASHVTCTVYTTLVKTCFALTTQSSVMRFVRGARISIRSPRILEPRCTCVVYPAV